MKYSNFTDEEYKKKKDLITLLENELQEIMFTGNRDVPQSTFNYKDLLKNFEEEKEE